MEENLNRRRLSSEINQIFLSNIRDTDNGLRYISFFTSFDCNLCCPYCYQRLIKKNLDAFTDEMIDHAFRSIDPVKKSENFFIHLVGGEPLLHSNNFLVSRVIENCKSHSYRLMITTNGSTLPSYSKLLLDNSFVFKNLKVSIDGDKELHLRNRNISSCSEFDYHKTIQTIIKLSSKIPITISSLMPNDADSLFFSGYSNMVNRLGKNNNIKFVLGFELEADTEFGVNLEALINCVEIVRLNWKKIKYPQSISIEFPLFKMLYAAYKNERIIFPSEKACHAGRDHFIFLSDGGIYPCELYLKQENRGLGTYVSKLQFNTLYDEFLDYNLNQFINCHRCINIILCSGGCPAQNENGNHKDVAPNCGIFGNPKIDQYIQVLAALILAMNEPENNDQ